MSTRQKRTHKDTNSIKIITPTAVIKPSETERLLGAEVDQKMKWRKHLLDSENSLVKCLNKRVGALKQICQVSSFKTRKMIADGIFISKLIYLMPAWVGCEEYLVDVLQVCQNKAARLVTKLDRFTPTRVLLRQCGKEHCNCQQWCTTAWYFSGRFSRIRSQNIFTRKSQQELPRETEKYQAVPSNSQNS